MLIVCLVTPTLSANSSCDKSNATRAIFNFMFFKVLPPNTTYHTGLAHAHTLYTQLKKDFFMKSIFKSGKTTTTKQDFTNKYIELINTLEKSKNVNNSHQP